VTRRTKYILLGVGIVFLAMQLKTVQRTNPLGAGDPTASREGMWILRRACYDCHSTESRWPIWAYVAPMSWRVVRDVDRARVALNFSDWVAYPVERRVSLRATIAPITITHRMPLWYYVSLHPDARLSRTELETLQQWSRHASEERGPRPR
jgi:Haem-binding domain